jgi:hypothetical protein
LGSGCLGFVLHVVFSKNETGRGRQVVVDPFQKRVVYSSPRVSWVVIMVFVSLGKAFGGVRFL